MKKVNSYSKNDSIPNNNTEEYIENQTLLNNSSTDTSNINMKNFQPEESRRPNHFIYNELKQIDNELKRVEYIYIN